jgi:hypothetical protein
MPTQKKARKSRRAEILKEVLDHFDVWDWYEGEGHLIFGPVAAELAEEGEFSESLRQARIRAEGSTEAEREGRRIMQEFRRNVFMRGDTLSAERTTMGETPAPKPFYQKDRYSREGIQAFQRLVDDFAQHASQLQEQVQELERSHPNLLLFDKKLDDLDARYAREAVGKIEKIVSRVNRLDPPENRD